MESISRVVPAGLFSQLPLLARLAPEGKVWDGEMMNKEFTFSNGVTIPAIGYGTYLTPAGKQTYEGVKAALELGYRHIDTATAYGNEVDVGAALKDSGLKREDVFITTKHWINMRGYEKTIQAAENSLKLLGTDYIDLYLIHWPCVQFISPEWKEINASTWRGFERLYKDGKIRAIGVSNFEKKHLDALEESCEIYPMANQLEYHPGWLQADTVKYSQGKGMVVEAYCPLGADNLIKNDLLLGLARKYNKTVAQICVRFILQNGVLPLPKSLNPEHIKSNLEVYDFELSAEDVALIEAMPKTAFTGWIPEEAPADTLN